jgi:hypothetical protein
MAEWGLSLPEAVSLTDEQYDGLLSGYVGRKKYEAKVLVSVLGEAMTPKDKPMTLSGLAAAGFGIRGA